MSRVAQPPLPAGLTSARFPRGSGRRVSWGPLYLRPPGLLTAWGCSCPPPPALQPGTGCPQSSLALARPRRLGRPAMGSAGLPEPGVGGESRQGFCLSQEVHLPVASWGEGGRGPRGGGWAHQGHGGCRGPVPGSLGAGGLSPSRFCVCHCRRRSDVCLPPKRGDQDEPQKSPCACTSFSQRVTPKRPAPRCPSRQGGHPPARPHTAASSWQHGRPRVCPTGDVLGVCVPPACCVEDNSYRGPAPPRKRPGEATAGARRAGAWAPGRWGLWAQSRLDLGRRRHPEDTAVRPH